MRNERERDPSINPAALPVDELNSLLWNKQMQRAKQLIESKAFL